MFWLFLLLGILCLAVPALGGLVIAVIVLYAIAWLVIKAGVIILIVLGIIALLTAITKMK